ncbi:carbohydrate kinase (thermoresistant glucokinase family) [Roseomonas alkaliterrae]|uniref:Gluconokinase n=1 Tax=Neoroseomonas alkaliterrae TaxID=1452450 RepID=A0A840Y1U0_9PROT|nr:gluconokinase [Neoroseomonas alkaliterrae]MBB5690337.1 carbohydrate kinase (thermoresistant glucokinase family) [Neoroseomonas alkaliterrae]
MSLAGIVVMGVSGAGKSTVGALLAERLGWPFEDGDSFHPPANVEKMRAGTPLTDEDRWPWLAAIAARITAARAEGRGVVIACSALKRAYRDVLRAGHADIRFLHLTGEPALIMARQAARQGHYMPASLVASQFATLEPPDTEADVIDLDVDPDPPAIVQKAVAALRRRGDLA